MFPAEIALRKSSIGRTIPTQTARQAHSLPDGLSSALKDLLNLLSSLCRAMAAALTYSERTE